MEVDQSGPGWHIARELQQEGTDGNGTDQPPPRFIHVISNCSTVAIETQVR